ncbi:MAG: branched-chain amino acid ABC transporter permease [Gammaproteobacteria bacterium]|nr:branched-chain amino acid ABC transporter permease [Gammaproteobacteria bacterium]
MMTSELDRPRDWTWWVVAYVIAAIVIKVQVFSGTGLLDTFAFLALLASLFLASSVAMAPWARAAIFVVLLMAVIPYIGLRNTFYLDVVTQVGIFAALALGLNIVVGFAGLLDLGFVAFFAVGAYTWAIFGSAQANQFLSIGATASFFPLPPDFFFVILMLTVIIAATAGVLLGLPVLRLRGDYLAIVTLGFGEVIRVLANNLDKPVNITNGPRGITGIGQPLSSVAKALGTSLIPPFKWQALIYYALVLAVIGLAIFFTRRLDNSKIGRAWVAIREDEVAAQAMGVPLVRTKLIAFATGASFAGVMGALFASKQTFISPESFDFNQSIGVLAMVVLGGLGSVRGAIVGAAIVTILNLQVLKALSTWLNGLRADGVEILGYSLANLPAQFEPSKYERLIFGLILIAMMLYRPQGLVPEKRRAHELARKAGEINISAGAKKL